MHHLTDTFYLIFWIIWKKRKCYCFMSLSLAWVTTAANDLFNTAQSGNPASLATSESVSQFFLCVYRRLFPAPFTYTRRFGSFTLESKHHNTTVFLGCTFGLSTCVYHYLCLVSFNLFFVDRLDFNGASLWGNVYMLAPPKEGLYFGGKK